VALRLSNSKTRDKLEVGSTLRPNKMQLDAPVGTPLNTYR